jgi:2-amino-4-hydroxy-6-hydroxymethyldihydropteridine diphosphokinase
MIIIALGSNLTGTWGAPRQTVERALLEMSKNNIRVLKVSPLLITPPMGPQNQPDYVNAVAVVDTHLPPDTLMRALHMIERRAGRKRLKRWGPRTLDLDLVDYHGLIRKPATRSIKPLALPHPGVMQRVFVLEPLVAVAPKWRHPQSHLSAALTLRKLKGLNAD